MLRNNKTWVLHLKTTDNVRDEGTLKVDSHYGNIKRKSIHSVSVAMLYSLCSVAYKLNKC